MNMGIFLLLALRLPTAVQDGREPPRHLRPFALWEGSKPGAFVQSIELEELSNWRSEWSVTTTLKNLGALEARIEVTQTHDPKTTGDGTTIIPRVQSIARNLSRADPYFNAASTKLEQLPDEHVLVGDRTFECHVSRFEDWKPAFNPGIKVGHELKLWYSSDVPGGIVKAEGLEVSGGDRSTGRVEFAAQLESLNEKLIIKEKGIHCVLLEIKAKGKYSFPGMNPPSESTSVSVERIWLSNEVPGKVARRTVADGAKSFTATVLDFGDRN